MLENKERRSFARVTAFDRPRGKNLPGVLSLDIRVNDGVSHDVGVEAVVGRRDRSGRWFGDQMGSKESKEGWSCCDVGRERGVSQTIGNG